MGFPDTSHFLNVDLEVASRSDLRPLIDALGENVFVLYSDRRGSTYYAHFELSARVKTADFATQRFCALIKALPRSKRDLWNRASKRDFSIGVQIMDAPRNYDSVLARETVEAAAAVGARIVFTAYSPAAVRKSV